MILQNKSRLHSYIKEHPLQVILLAALVLRLLAAFFSKGYAFHDDHFCVLRVAQSWANGIPHWLESIHPPKHSMVYAGVNAVLIWISEKAGITDPIAKATVLRLIHAFYSLLTIYFAYKITLLLSTKRNAILVGWILALLWFMPYLSVSFLAELVCVPPVLAGFYYIIKAEKEGDKNWWPWLVAGILFGVAFTIRIHTVLFAGGMGLVLLSQQKWMESMLFTVAYLLIVFTLIGIPDIIFFQYPFQYVVDYFIHNSENAYNYVTGSPFKFLLTTFGFLVPPISVFLMLGYIKTWKVEPKIFLAVLIFFLVHSLFPNKQERFLLPMYPLLIILGVIGWNKFKDQSKFWQNYSKIYRGVWQFFWAMNVVAAIALALTFTKKDRIEPLHYLSKKDDVKAVIIESERNSVKQPPVYYLGNACSDYDEFRKEVLGLNQLKVSKKYLDPDYIMTFSFGAHKTAVQLRSELQAVNKEPNYVVMRGSNNLEERQQRVLSLFPNKQLTLLHEVHPSRFDRLLHFLNPGVHRNGIVRVYKIK